MTQQDQIPSTKATDASDSNLRSVVDDLRDELWQRELRIQQLEATPVREAVRRSVSRRIHAASETLSLPHRGRSGLKRIADKIKPRDRGIRRLAGLYPYPDSAHPIASIVIPVHDQLDATLRCLESIFLATAGVDYEIIVVDDCSSEYTRKELRQIPHLHLLELPENLGYLQATNRGTAMARGDFIILLNNDTEVLDGWLDAILDTFADPTVGAVGAKLLLPDGSVQEAGAIVWDDGTARHVARGFDRHDGRSSFARDVDYSSAACLAIRSELWRKIGGFDTHFTPAYYEDVDLCFSVRAQGFRVRYQPAAEVIHHEGTSHGGDETVGIKKYQAINHVKFAKKWSDELRNHHRPGTAEAIAMHRGSPDLRVLIADHQVPRPNEDAGSLRMQVLVEELVARGAQVTFACPNDDVPPLDSLALGRLGVEVANSDYPLHSRLKDYGKAIDLVILSRPQVCLQLLPDVRRYCPSATVAFDTVDIHHVREGRDTANPTTSRIVSEAFREIERAAIAATDCTIVVSELEASIVQDLDPDAEIEIYPTVNRLAEVVSPPGSREGVLFVGGFAHPPNIDAAHDLAREILPIVRQRRPHTELWIVGSRAPKEVEDLGNLPGIRFLGFVEDLDPLLQERRCLAAPIRWGAGVKGKITQSLAAGLPVVTSTVGAEGIGLQDGINGLIADGHAEFADAMVRLLEDDSLWSRISDAGLDLARTSFAPSRAADLVSRLEVRSRERLA